MVSLIPKLDECLRSEGKTFTKIENGPLHFPWSPVISFWHQPFNSEFEYIKLCVLSKSTIGSYNVYIMCYEYTYSYKNTEDNVSFIAQLTRLDSCRGSKHL